MVINLLIKWISHRFLCNLGISYKQNSNNLELGTVNWFWLICSTKGCFTDNGSNEIKPPLNLSPSLICLFYVACGNSESITDDRSTDYDPLSQTDKNEFNKLNEGKWHLSHIARTLEYFNQSTKMMRVLIFDQEYDYQNLISNKINELIYWFGFRLIIN